MLQRYTLEGQTPVPEPDLMKWAVWMNAEDGRRVVRQTCFAEDCLVSTVFLSMGHNWSMQGPPVLFETMVFGVPGMEDWQARYRTWEEAAQGHRDALAEVKRHLFTNHPRLHLELHRICDDGGNEFGGS